jgi:hypothetical protein
MSTFQLSMAIPTDSDGFARRECPTCERELKWRLASADEEATPAPHGGYFCPYCGVQALPDAWWTKAQVEAAQAQAYREVLKPEIKKRFQGVKFTDNDSALPLTETDDMRRVDFACHDEPVKVLDDWHGPVHCSLCGTATATPTA